MLHGFVRPPGGPITTFDAPGAGTGVNQGTNMASYEGLNPAGVLVGWYTDVNYVNHGYVRAPDGMITTFDAPGAGTAANQDTFAYGVTPAGAIPGSLRLRERSNARLSALPSRESSPPSTFQARPAPMYRTLT